MSLRSLSGARIAVLAVAWIVGLPFVLFVVMQSWIMLPHDDAPGVSVFHVSLLTVLLVLLGPPLLLVALWIFARRLDRDG